MTPRNLDLSESERIIQIGCVYFMFWEWLLSLLSREQQHPTRMPQHFKRATARLTRGRPTP